MARTDSSSCASDATLELVYSSNTRNKLLSAHARFSVHVTAAAKAEPYTSQLLLLPKVDAESCMGIEQFVLCIWAVVRAEV